MEVKTSFDDLTEYAKIEIFRFLDKKSLLNCFRVSKSWYKLINDNQKVLARLEMKFPNKWNSDKANLLENSRKFIKMYFKHFKVEDSSILDCVISVSQDVEILEVEHAYFLTQEPFYEFITCFPKLKKLFISHSRICKFIQSRGEEDNMKDLPKLNLQKLILLRMGIIDKVFKALAEIKVQSEEIIVDFRDYYCSDHVIGEVAELLSIQDNLVSLGIKFYCSKFEAALQNLFGSLMSHLKRVLTIRDFFLFAKHQHLHGSEITNVALDKTKTSFIYFLESVKSTLRCLEIKCYTLPTFVLTKLINDLQLERLYIDAADFHGSLDFQQPNKHLKSMLIIKYLPRSIGIQLFKAFPNVQFLELFSNDFYSDENVTGNLISVAKHLKTLKYLHVGEFPNEIPEICIPSLTAFFIYNKLSIDGTRMFLNSNPAIQTLLYYNRFTGTMITHENLDQLTQNLRNLKKIIIHQEGKFIVNTEMLQMLSANCANLESLQVKTESDKSNDKLKFRKVQLRYFKKDEIEEIFNQKTPIWKNDKDIVSHQWDGFDSSSTEYVKQDYGSSRDIEMLNDKKFDMEGGMANCIVDTEGFDLNGFMRRIENKD